MAYGRWNFDLAYGAFFFYGLVTLGSSLLPVLPLLVDTKLFIGSVILTPLHALSLIGLIIGICVGLRLLRDWKIAALIVALIADWALFAFTLTGESDLDFMISASIVYGLFTCVISAAWFVSGRAAKSVGSHGVFAA